MHETTDPDNKTGPAMPGLFQLLWLVFSVITYQVFP
jgi:hypothetical protein